MVKHFFKLIHLQQKSLSISTKQNTIYNKNNMCPHHFGSILIDIYSRYATVLTYSKAKGIAT
jgi:hypothetical protein